MSYQDRVIRDNPVGFWILDSSPSMGTDYSAGYFSSGVRTTNTATIGAGVVSTDVLPLCTGGTNAARISNGATSKITIANNYEMFYKYTENNSFSMEFWISFDYPPTSSTVVSIGTNITLSFVDSLAKLMLKDSSGNTYYAYLSVDTYDSQLHVVINYSNRVLNFLINGVSSTKISMFKDSYFIDTSAINIVFGPSTGSDYFILDCIAFYNYSLDSEKIIAHMAWAVSNNSPKTYTILNNGGFYDGINDDPTISQRFLFNSEESWNYGYMDNVISEADTLTVKKIPPLLAYNQNEFNSPKVGYSTKSTRPGLVTYGATDDAGLTITDKYNAAVCNNFNQYFDPKYHTIQCQVYIQSTSDREVYFSITNFSFGNLVLSKPAGALTVRLFSDEDANINITSATLTVGWHNIRIIFNGTKTYLYVDGTLSGTGTITSSSIYLEQFSTLYIGNYFYSSTAYTATYPTTSPIQNFSIHNDNSSRLSSYANIGVYTTVLNNTLAISQYGEWKTLLPISSSDTINASKAYLETSSSMTNVQLWASPDDSTYTQLGTNGEQIPGLQLNTTGSQRYIKIIMQSSDSFYGRPSVKILDLLTYKTLYSNSEGMPFSIKEYVGSNQFHTYNDRTKNFNLLARSINFGIHFEPQNGVQVPGMAVINVPSGNTYRTIEFWFRVDTNAGAANNYLLDVDNPTAASLSHNASLVLNYAGADWSAVYINGQSYTNNNKTLVLGEIYHFMGVLNADKSNEIGINAKHNYTFHAHATYGEVCLYSDVKTQPFAQTKYNIQIGRNTQVISDNSYSLIVDKATPITGNWNIISSSIM